MFLSFFGLFIRRTLGQSRNWLKTCIFPMQNHSKKLCFNKMFFFKNWKNTFFFLFPVTGKKGKKSIFSICVVYLARVWREQELMQNIHFSYIKSFKKFFFSLNGKIFKVIWKIVFFFGSSFFNFRKNEKNQFFQFRSRSPPPRGVPREIYGNFHWIGRGSYGQFFFLIFSNS